MVDLFKAETVNSDILIDEKMSIVTADENFEAISGNNALFVYTRYIHPDDVSRFTEALKDYADSGKFIVVRMLYQTGEYHWMLTRITDGGVSETRGHMYDINIIDAALITTQIDNLNSQIERYSSYLGMCENVLFPYASTIVLPLARHLSSLPSLLSVLIVISRLNNFSPLTSALQNPSSSFTASGSRASVFILSSSHAFNVPR